MIERVMLSHCCGKYNSGSLNTAMTLMKSKIGTRD